jgi:hypothetical protein
MKRRLFCTIFPWFGLGERLFGDTLFRNGKLPEIKKYLDNPKGLPVLRRNMPVGELFQGVELKPSQIGPAVVFQREVMAWIPEGMYLHHDLRYHGEPSFFGECRVHQTELRFSHARTQVYLQCCVTENSIPYGYGDDNDTITFQEVANG